MGRRIKLVDPDLEFSLLVSSIRRDDMVQLLSRLKSLMIHGGELQYIFMDSGFCRTWRMPSIVGSKRFRGPDTMCGALQWSDTRNHSLLGHPSLFPDGLLMGVQV